jgi:hypothetical protein
MTRAEVPAVLAQASKRRTIETRPNNLWPIIGVATATSCSAHSAEGADVDDDKRKHPVLERAIDSFARSLFPAASPQGHQGSNAESAKNSKPADHGERVLAASRHRHLTHHPQAAVPTR